MKYICINCKRGKCKGCGGNITTSFHNMKTAFQINN